MKSQKSSAIVYSIQDVSDDISTFRTSIKIRLCPGWAQGSWLSNAAKTIAIRLITSEITVISAEKISPRHLIRKKAVLKAVQGARAMFSLSSVTTNTESGRKARKRGVFKSGDAAMYTLMCQVHLLCEHTRDHLSNVNCYCNFISKLCVTEILDIALWFLDQSTWYYIIIDYRIQCEVVSIVIYNLHLRAKLRVIKNLD